MVMAKAKRARSAGEIPTEVSTWLRSVLDGSHYRVPMPCAWKVHRAGTGRHWKGPKLTHATTEAALRQIVEEVPGRYWLAPLDPNTGKRYRLLVLAVYDLVPTVPPPDARRGYDESTPGRSRYALPERVTARIGRRG